MKNLQAHILLISLFAVFSCPVRTFSKESGLGLHTVCIDAGHGGHDPGCVSRDKSRTQEKVLALNIAKSLKAKIEEAYPDVKVIMTRSNDTFIPLADRASVANKHNADLFISIHIDAAKSTSAHGYSVYVMGHNTSSNRDLVQGNLELTKRENSVILLEKDYSTTYQGYDPNDPESFIFFNLMQNAHLEQSLDFADCINRKMASGPIRHSRGVQQAGFLVLWRTTMPSVLVECGYISNAADLAVLTKTENQDGIAEGIFNGFVEFKTKYDKSLNISKEESAGKTQTVNPQKSDTQAKETVYYGIQVLASSKLLKQEDAFFKGNVPVIEKSGNLYKYILAKSASEEDVRKKYPLFKNNFPQCFPVRVENGKIERIR